jgi:uncharacterized protein DUF4164
VRKIFSAIRLTNLPDTLHSMGDAEGIEGATRRLALALDALEAAVDRRCEADRGADGLAAQLHAMVSDRSKLAADLDAAAASARGLETTNREVARRLDEAIGTIRSVLAAGEP